MKRLFVLFISCAILASCGITSSTSTFGESRQMLSVEIFQTLNKYEALAWTSNYDVVKLETTAEIFYDRKKINGYFKLIDTYSYKNKDGHIKTVPVYVREKELATTEIGKSSNQSFEIFQTLGDGEALAWDSNGVAVKLITESEMYFDRKKINGFFTLIGTYQYENRKVGLKTVPVYIRTSEYKKIKDSDTPTIKI